MDAAALASLRAQLVVVAVADALGVRFGRFVRCAHFVLAHLAARRAEAAEQERLVAAVAAHVQRGRCSVRDRFAVRVEPVALVEPPSAVVRAARFQHVCFPPVGHAPLAVQFQAAVRLLLAARRVPAAHLSL